MSGIISHLLEFPPNRRLFNDEVYHKEIKYFLDTLEKLDVRAVQKDDDTQNFLQMLDPSVNSVSYLFILLLRARALTAGSNIDPRPTFLQALNFLQQFDGVQMRYVGSWLRELIDVSIQIASHLNSVCTFP